MKPTVGARVIGVVTAAVLVFGAAVTACSVRPSPQPSVLPLSSTGSSDVVEPSARQSAISELMALNPGTTEAELIDLISHVAAETGMTEDQVIAQALEEGRRSVAAASAAGASAAQRSSDEGDN